MRTHLKVVFRKLSHPFLPWYRSLLVDRGELNNLFDDVANLSLIEAASNVMLGDLDGGFVSEASRAYSREAGPRLENYFQRKRRSFKDKSRNVWNIICFVNFKS